MNIIPKKGKWIHVKEIIPTTTPVHTMALYYAFPSKELYWENEEHLSSFGSNGYEKHPRTGKDLWDLRHTFGTMERAKLALYSYITNKSRDYTKAEEDLLSSKPRKEWMTNYPLETGVHILTEHGGVNLKPNEYTIASDELVEEYLDKSTTDHCDMVFLANNNKLNRKIKEQLFYIRSRGISNIEAMKMIFPSVSSANVYYLRMHPAYVNHFHRKFESYATWHLKGMNKSGMKSEFESYLSLVKQVEGMSEFKMEYLEEEITTKETNLT